MANSSRRFEKVSEVVRSDLWLVVKPTVKKMVWVDPETGEREVEEWEEDNSSKTLDGCDAD
ncbi:MAG: hypothetical protein AAB467_00865 [Patescibacteria group bacterium]